MGMLTEPRRADELHIGDRVLTVAGTVLTVTSTRMQGAGPGVVSLGFAERPARMSCRPGDELTVLHSLICRPGSAA